MQAREGGIIVLANMLSTFVVGIYIHVVDTCCRYLAEPLCNLKEEGGRGTACFVTLKKNLNTQ